MESSTKNDKNPPHIHMGLFRHSTWYLPDFIQLWILLYGVACWDASSEDEVRTSQAWQYPANRSSSMVKWSDDEPFWKVRVTADLSTWSITKYMLNSQTETPNFQQQKNKRMYMYTLHLNKNWNFEVLKIWIWNKMKNEANHSYKVRWTFFKRLEHRESDFQGKVRFKKKKKEVLYGYLPQKHIIPMDTGCTVQSSYY